MSVCLTNSWRNTANSGSPARIPGVSAIMYHSMNLFSLTRLARVEYLRGTGRAIGLFHRAWTFSMETPWKQTRTRAGKPVGEDLYDSIVLLVGLKRDRRIVCQCRPFKSFVGLAAASVCGRQRGKTVSPPNQLLFRNRSRRRTPPRGISP